MSIEISSLNLVALAPQLVVIVAALVLLLAELFRGEEETALPPGSTWQG